MASLITFSSLALAGGFVPSEEAIKTSSFTGVKNATESTLKIFDYGISAKCSAAYISNQGHILTAAHCIQKCLDEAGIKRERIQVSENIKITKIDQTSFSADEDSKECIIDINSSPQRVKILAVGLGEINAKPNKISAQEWALMDQLRQQGYGEQSDYAVLKFYAHKYNCAPLSLETIGIGQSIWAVGYPSRTNRIDDENWPDSDGYGQFVSQGVRTKGVQDMAGLRLAIQNRNYTLLSDSIEDVLWNLSVDEIMQNLMRENNTPELIPSTVDMVSGNSGGPLFNSSGKLVGVNVSLLSYILPTIAGIYYESRHYVAGVTRSVSIQSIYKDIVRLRGQKEATDIFKCEPEE